MSGYYTIPLNTTVPLTAGHQFSVVIEITTPGDNSPIPVEESALQDGQPYSTATAQPGQSYFSATGTSWTDATQIDSTMNICIKAFAQNETVVGAPAVSAQNANGLDLFVRGADSAIYWKHSPDGTTWPLASVDLGGFATADPAATSNGTGNIAVFIRGGAGALWEKTTTNGGATWSAWTSLGGTLASGTGPAACFFG